MSNHKFRLSNMIPNSWFYKLRAKKTKTKDPPIPSKKHPSSLTNFGQKPQVSRPKQPYHYSWESPKSKTHHDTKSHTSSINLSLSGFDDHFPELPRISISRRKTIYKPSPTSRCQFRYDQSSFDLDCLSSRSPPPEFKSDESPELFKGIDSVSTSCSCGCNSITYSKNDSISEKRRITKKKAARKYSSPSSGIKLRTNTPRISMKKIQGQQQQRRRVSSAKKCVKKEGVFESMAVVKESDDPEKDFRESMMEMIVENNIRASKDLEELLACYLSLNSNEYHQLIINAFDHIWFKIPDF